MTTVISATRVQIVDSVQHPVRFSYFYGHEPSINTDKETGRVTKSYGNHFLMKPDHPAIPLILAAINAAGVAFFKDQWPLYLPSIKAKSKLPLRKGEIHKPLSPEYHGMFSLTASKPFEKGKFRMVETRGGVNVDLLQADGRPYSGCFGSGIVNFYGYNKGGGIGIGCGIEGVQYTRQGDAFGGGRVASANEFAPVEVGESADAPPPGGAVFAGNVDALLGFGGGQPAGQAVDIGNLLGF